MKSVILTLIATASLAFAAAPPLTDTCLEYKAAIISIIEAKNPMVTDADAVAIVEKLGPPSKKFTANLNAFASENTKEEVVATLSSTLTFTDDERAKLADIGEFLKLHKDSPLLQEAYAKWEIEMFKN